MSGDDVLLVAALACLQSKRSAMAAPHPRTHDLLRRESTRDPIFLFQRREAVWYPNAPYDHDAESFVVDGRELTGTEAVDQGFGVWRWRTETVFLTRSEGEQYGRSRSYNYPDGWRVYCVAAEGALCGALADATEGGRYS